MELGSQAPTDAGLRRRKPWLVPLIIVCAVVAVVLALVGAGVFVRSSPGRRVVGRTVGRALFGDDQFFTMGGTGMEPTLQPGDFVGADSRIGTLRRGALVVINEGAGRPPLVKRVVGLPGEQISTAPDGGVAVNGQPLAEPYMSNGNMTSGIATTTIPAASYFVLGDNRDQSVDSRQFGPVRRQDIVAVVTQIIRPKDRARTIPTAVP